MVHLADKRLCCFIEGQLRFQGRFQFIPRPILVYKVLWVWWWKSILSYTVNLLVISHLVVDPAEKH